MRSYITNPLEFYKRSTNLEKICFTKVVINLHYYAETIMDGKTNRIFDQQDSL